MSSDTRQGSCLCGAARFTVTGPLDDVDLCHCGQCRRANGGAFNVAVIVDRTAVAFNDTASIREYSGSAGKYRAFCGECGSPLYSRRDDLPARLRLRGGTIADLPTPKRMRHIYFNSRWPWIDAMFEAPKCEEI